MYNDDIYFSLYKKLYNDNKYFLIHENVYRLIQDDVYFSYSFIVI